MSLKIKILTRSDCEKILQNSISETAKLQNFTLAPFSDKTIGFLGNYYRLTLTFFVKDHDESKTYFIKHISPENNDFQTNLIREMEVFEKEALLYKNLLTHLLKIYPFGPLCYLIQPNCIVLEDLGERGFKMLPKKDYLKPEECGSLIKNLARFHATSIIFEEQNHFKIDEKFKDEIRECCYSFNEGRFRQKWCTIVTQCIIDIIELLPESDCKNTGNVTEKFRNYVFGDLPKLIRPSQKFRNVVTHDDLWRNNMLFTDSLECVFVDFQMARYTPPALDFFVTLFMNVEVNYLEKNLSYFIDFYYDTMRKILAKFDLDIDDLLPRNIFNQSLDVYKLPAFVEAVMYGTNTFISQQLADQILANDENLHTFMFTSRSKFIVKEYSENESFGNKFRSLLVPLIKILEERM